MVFLISTIIIFFLDAILLPSFFNFKFSSLLSLFLIAIILYSGVNKKSIWIGISISALIEIIFKYNPGSYVISFIILILIIFLVSKFLNLPLLKHANIYTVLGLSLFAPFLNYLLFFIFIAISGYIKSDHRLILPMYSPVNPLLIFCYLLETFLILFMFRFLESIKNVQKRI